MFNKPTSDQAMALAAVFQACHLVDMLANSGQAPTDDIKLSMAALLNQNPSSLQDMYGPSDNLQTGINAMTTLLGDRQNTTTFTLQTLSYVLTVLSIERQLNSRPEMLESIASGIDSANRQAQHFSIVHDNVFANLGHILTGADTATIYGQCKVEGVRLKDGRDIPA